MTSYNVDLPFKVKHSVPPSSHQPSCCCGFVAIAPRPTLNQYGKCCQGAGGLSSHTKSLYWSYDFLLPEGSPILSARNGVIVAAVDVFQGGGTDIKFKARANYVVVRHEDDGYYSRYYHLQFNSVVVHVGDTVQAGDLLGCSGNTGYTTGPHLHFDVVDFCIYASVNVSVAMLDTTTTTTTTTTTESNPRKEKRLYACNASFSHSMLPGDAPLRGRVQWTDPPDATMNPLLNASDVLDAIAVIHRCGKIDFIEKASRAQDAGAIAVVIVNNEMGPALHVCAIPKGVTTKILIPVVMVTMAAGTELINGDIMSISNDTSSLHNGHASSSSSSSSLPPPRSKLRDEWKEFGCDQKFSPFAPVTVGPVCFCVKKNQGDMIIMMEEDEAVSDNNNVDDEEEEDKEEDTANEYQWLNPKTDERPYTFLME